MVTKSYNRANNDISFNYLRLIANTLAIVGSLNWGLIGINGFDLVAYVFGHMSTLSRIIYTAVGLAGVYLLSCLINRSLNK